MGFDLNLILRGLCAVVPDGNPIEPQDLVAPLQVPGVTVLVLAAKLGVVDDHPICDHIAKIEAEQPEGPNQVVVLAGHRIEISPLLAGTVQLNASFWKLADLKRIYPGVAFKPSLFADTPPLDLVVAKLQVPVGLVSGFDFSPQRLSFPDRGYEGNFALAVKIRIPIDAATATLTATPFEGGAAETVTLTPQPGHTSVEVTLSNLCSQAADVAVPDFATAVQRRDADFAIYSRLMADLLDSVQVPQIVQGSLRDGEAFAQATDSGGSCIPSRGSGSGT